MDVVEKACPIVARLSKNCPEILAFRHPLAGKQFVKGTVEASERPIDAAARELFEESGITSTNGMRELGSTQIGAPGVTWHFFGLVCYGLPDRWLHYTTDGGGHTFDFFWHPLDKPLDSEWHSDFHEAYAYFSNRLSDVFTHC